ncbi:MAG: hypothetical protein E7812_08265 [Phenylobacterium sp.]|nr:MAG: hypothetical protein E7812_08265 [Phenylobacterium sp.]
MARVTYSEELGTVICERVAGGESVRVLCRAPEMPHRTTVQDWAAQHPEFEVALAEAQQAARLARRRRDLALARKVRDPRGLWSTYTPQVGRAICRRLEAGGTVAEIACEPWAPCKATIFNWARAIPEFADAYARARMLAMHRLVDEVREVGLSVTPETVAAHRAQFRLLRAQAATIAARKYLEPVAEVEAAAGRTGRWANSSEPGRDFPTRRRCAPATLPIKGREGASRRSPRRQSPRCRPSGRS